MILCIRKEEGRRKKEEGRRKKEEGGRKKNQEEGRRKKEKEGRKKEYYLSSRVGKYSIYRTAKKILN